jgi:hypothetical protein
VDENKPVEIRGVRGLDGLSGGSANCCQWLRREEERNWQKRTILFLAVEISRMGSVVTELKSE